LSSLKTTIPRRAEQVVGVVFVAEAEDFLRIERASGVCQVVKVAGFLVLVVVEQLPEDLGLRLGQQRVTVFRPLTRARCRGWLFGSLGAFRGLWEWDGKCAGPETCDGTVFLHLVAPTKPVRWHKHCRRYDPVVRC
jgi:hypothetical protein